MQALSLNDAQRAAAEHGGGPLMVLAGPGSGKTTVITYRALNLARGLGVPPERVLVFTYSKAASEQMRRRYDALTDVPRERGVCFGTFHAVFYRILRARYNITTEQVLSEDERRAVVRKLLVDAGYAIEDDFTALILNELSLVKNELYDLKYYHSAAIGADEFKTLYNNFEARKKELNKLDFDDMLTRCYTLLSTEPDTLAAWRARFKYIMVDEFQDINRVQYECVKLLALPASNLLIVGDDDQSIYRFRGARPEFLLNFPKDFPETESVVLGVNYRSTDQIISFGNTLIAGNRVRYPKEITGTGKTGGAPCFLTAEDINAEAAAVAGRIKKLLTQGRSPGDIAVVYRVNVQSRAFADAFLTANIPYQVKDEISVIYEHWAAKDIFAYLRLAASGEQGFGPLTERIINKPYRYISKAFLAAAKKDGDNIFDIYARSPSLNDAQRLRIDELKTDIRNIGRLGPVDAVRYIRRSVDYDGHIRDHAAYRKLDASGLFEIAEEIQDAAKQFDTIEAFLAHAEDATNVSKAAKTRGDIPRVTLTTLHSAKGLEFETVFIAGAVEGVIPHERSKTEAELEEERRLLYVGVTRAKRELLISIPRTRYDKPVKPSRFITPYTAKK